MTVPKKRPNGEQSLRAVRHSQLPEDGSEMRLYGRLSNREIVRDLLVRRAVRERQEHVVLSARQSLDARSRRGDARVRFNAFREVSVSGNHAPQDRGDCPRAGS